jgi:hypothetical protein
MTPHFWNTDKIQVGRNKIRYTIGSGMRNFRKAGASWNRINTSIESDLSSINFPAEVQIGQSSQDWHETLFNSSFSMRRYHNLKEENHPEPAIAMRFQVETQHNVLGSIEDGFPSQVRYRNAWDGADLRIGLWHGMSARIEKVIEVHTEPSGNSDFVKYDFNIQLKRASLFQRGLRFIQPGQQKYLKGDSIFVSQDDSELRGFVLRRPVCWWYKDGELVRHNVKIIIKYDLNGELLQLTKFIPRILIQQAIADGSFLRTDTVFQPDADPETDSMDFWTQRSAATQTWSQLWQGNGTGASASQTLGYIRIRSDTTSNTYNLMNRCNQLFETSSLTGVADTGTLKVRISTKADPSSYWTSDLGLFGTTTTNTTAPVIGDFQLAGTTSYATAIAYGSVSTTVYNTFTLNTAGLAAVDTAGMSKFVTALSTYDLGGSTPTWYTNNNHNYRQWQAEQGTLYAPELEVTTVIPPNTPAALLL